MFFVDNTVNKQGGPLPGLPGKHNVWPWAQVWLFASTILVHLLQPQEAVRDKLLPPHNFLAGTPFFSR